MQSPVNAEAIRKPPPPVRDLVRAIPPRHPLVYAALHGFLCPIWRVYFRIRGEGLDHLPRQGGYLVASNHVSMLDWAHLGYFLPRSVRFLISREMYASVVIRTGCRINGCVAVRTDRPDLAGLRAARAVLAADVPLVVFPEGGISLTGRPQHAWPGVISLATTMQTPIVPVAVRGAFETFPRWRRVPRPGAVTVAFGRPLPPPPPGTTRGHQQRLADDLMAHITALLDGESRPPGWQDDRGHG